MSTTMTHPSFSVPFFTQLVLRLRCANARYNRIAHQYRRTQRLTYHAKRHAYRAGLRIDTSKARAARFTKPLSPAPIQPLPISDSTARSPECVTTAAEAGTEAEDAEHACRLPSLGLALMNLPEVVVQKRPAGLSHASSSLPGLGLGPGSDLGVDRAHARDVPFQGPIPDAPRWRPIPLPECGLEVLVLAQPVSTVDTVYAADRITVPQCHLKRKLREFDEDQRPAVYRQPEATMRGHGYFSGTWRSGV